MASGRTRKGLIGAGLLVGGAAAGVAWRARRRALELEPAIPAPRLQGRPVAIRSADGTQIHAEVFGPEDRPTIVLVHGWTCSMELWHHQIEMLAGEFRVVAYDQRGHGRSGRSADQDYSIEAFAADLAAVLDQCLPEGERATVAGHSMGAMTIVALADRRPALVRERIGRVALLNTGVGDLITEALVLRTPPGLASVRQAVGTALLCSEAPLALPDAWLLSAVRKVALSPGADSDAVEVTAEMVRRCPPEVRSGCGTSLSRLDLYEAVASLEAPTLVVAGELDKLTPPSLSAKLAEVLPHPLRLVELPGVGHMSPLEAPDEISEHLQALAVRSQSVPAAG